MLSVAILLDILIPDPEISWHPIALIGRWIAFLERVFRHFFGNTYVSGFFLAGTSLLGTVGIIRVFLLTIERFHQVHVIISTILLYFLLCGATLRRSANRVYDALENNDLKKSRQKLQEIVGRDTSELTEEEIIRSVLETLSENTVDGLVAPLLFIFAGIMIGKPLLMGIFYKTINTLDSMVGYKNEAYLRIGFISAKLDDIANYLPARIGGLLIIFCGALIKLDWKKGWQMMIRDAHKHLSPNSGWPESATAGLLGVCLGGDAVYFGKLVKKASLGEERRPPERIDIKRINHLIVCLEVIFLLLSIILPKGLL